MPALKFKDIIRPWDRKLEIDEIHIVDLENGCTDYARPAWYKGEQDSKYWLEKVTKLVLIFRKSVEGETDENGNSVVPMIFLRGPMLLVMQFTATSEPEAADTHIVIAASELANHIQDAGATRNSSSQGSEFKPKMIRALRGESLQLAKTVKLFLVNGGDRGIGEITALCKEMVGDENVARVNGSAAAATLWNDLKSKKKNCYFCHNEFFNTDDAYDRHWRLEHPQCNSCNYSFPTQASLDTHTLTKRTHACSFRECCAPLCSAELLVAHVRECHPTCTIQACACKNVQFRTPRALRMHVTESSCGRVFPCVDPSCSGYFHGESFDSLVEHQFWADHITSYECELLKGNKKCGKKLLSAQAFSDHRRDAHKKKGVKLG